MCVSAAERLRKGVGELLGRVTLRVSWQQPVADWSVCVCVCVFDRSQGVQMYGSYMETFTAPVLILWTMRRSE